MATLICSLGTGKGSWGHITRLITDYDWDDIYIVTNEWGKEKFNIPGKELKWILINYNMGFDLMTKTIIDQLPEAKEYALNIMSGDGKVHMAMLNAMKIKNKDYKLAILTKDGLQFY